MTRAGRGNAVVATKDYYMTYSTEEVTWNDICKEIRKQYIALEIIASSGSTLNRRQRNFRTVVQKCMAPLIYKKNSPKAEEYGSGGYRIDLDSIPMRDLDAIVQTLRVRWKALRRSDVSGRYSANYKRMEKRLRFYKHNSVMIKSEHRNNERLYPLSVWASTYYSGLDFDKTFYNAYRKIRTEIMQLKDELHWMGGLSEEDRVKLTRLERMSRLPVRMLYHNPALFDAVFNGTRAIKRRFTFREMRIIIENELLVRDPQQYSNDTEWSKHLLHPLERVACNGKVTVIDTTLRRSNVFNRDRFRLEIERRWDINIDNALTALERMRDTGVVWDVTKYGFTQEDRDITKEDAADTEENRKHKAMFRLALAAQERCLNHAT